MKFRIARFKISDTTYETLFTDLPGNEIPAEAIHFCYQYFKGKFSERSLLKIVQKFMSPIRTSRVFERYQNIKNAVGFTYRIS